MNLYDLISRKDRAVEISGGVKAATPATLTGRVRAIVLAPGARVRIRQAHELTALAGFPTNPFWRVLGRWPAGGVRIAVEGEQSAPLAAVLPNVFGRGGEIRLEWPVDACGAYDFAIEHVGARPATIAVGPLFNPRAKLLPLLRGVGVEVGPGLNPQVLPGPHIDVHYVEEKSPEEWRKTYAGGEARPGPSAEVMTRTRQGSATTLDHWREHSLDFVFSNHVFEHIMNPLQVLRNWLSRLKPGGVIVGVTPDARYSFDCRQSISTLADIRSEAALGGFDPPNEKYERWVRYTAPGQTVAKLKKRRYSIHMHYYTPELFRAVAEELRGEGAIDGLFLNTTPNNKDFGFVLRKSRG